MSWLLSFVWQDMFYLQRIIGDLAILCNYPNHNNQSNRENIHRATGGGSEKADMFTCTILCA